MAPEGAEGGGGSDPTPPTPPAPEPPPTEPPAPEGATMEAKLTNATSTIKTIFGSLKDAVGKLNTMAGNLFKAQTDLTAMTTERDRLNGTLKTEQDAHTTTKGQLSTANTQVTGLTTERDKANKTVTRLEALCQLRGIDHKEAVPPLSGANTSADDRQEIVDRLNKETDPLARGQLANQLRRFDAKQKAEKEKDA